MIADDPNLEAEPTYHNWRDDYRTWADTISLRIEEGYRDEVFLSEYECNARAADEFYGRD